MSPFYLIVLGSLLMTGLASLWRGGSWERGVAMLLIAEWFASSLAPFDFIHPPWIVIAVDAAVFLGLLYASLYSGRPWTLSAAAFQFLILATHLVFAQDVRLEQWAYVSAYYVWNLGVILSLAAGVLRRGPAQRPQSPLIVPNANEPGSGT